MEIKHLEETAKAVIDNAKENKAIIVMCVDGFQTDDEALKIRDMLWYARNNGVVVHFVPEKIITTIQH